MPNRCPGCHQEQQKGTVQARDRVQFRCASCGCVWSSSRSEIASRFRGHIIDMVDAIQAGREEHAAEQARLAARLGQVLLATERKRWR